MRFRKMRIAWSVFWGVACVLLILLCVRSYFWMDAVPRLHLASANGQLYVKQNLQIQPASKDQRCRFGIISMSLGGQSVVRVGHPGLALPLWAVLVILAAVSVCPGIRRFTLRTLLIATTLVAVVLGLVVYVTQQ